MAALGCGGADLVLPTDSAPASLAPTGGEGQSATVGEALPGPLEVRVTDAHAQPVAGARVTFTAAAGDGGLSPETATTGDDGRASAQWVLGTQAGPQTASVSVAGFEDQAALRASFTATATAGAARRIAAVSGDDQTARAGAPLPDSLVVVVTDEFGNPVSGTEVVWNAQGGSLSPASVTTGGDGRAATRRVLGASSGTQTATAAAEGLDGSPVTFTHTAAPGNPTDLVLISGDGQTGPASEELPQPLVVRLVDAEGNGIAGSPVSWLIGAGGGSVTPNGDTDARGMASAAWRLGPTAGATNTLSAVVSGVGVVTFTATADGGGGGGGGDEGSGAGDHLIFLMQPRSSQEENRDFEPAVQVAVVSQSNNLVSLSGVRIHISLIGRKAKLQGHEDRDTQNGIAVFDDLRAKKAGAGYVLVASAPGRPELGQATSSPFDVNDR